MAISREFLNNLVAGLYGGVQTSDAAKQRQESAMNDMYKTLALNALQNQRIQQQEQAINTRTQAQIEATNKRAREREIAAQKRLEEQLKAQEKLYNKRYGNKGGSTGISKAIEPLIKARAEAYQSMLKSLLPDRSGTVDPNRTMFYKSQLEQYNQQLGQYGIPPITVNDTFLNKFFGIEKQAEPMSQESLARGFNDPSFAQTLLQHKIESQIPDNRPTFQQYLEQRGQDVANANKQVFPEGTNIDATKIQQTVPYTKVGKDGNLYELTPNGWKRIKKPVESTDLEKIFGVKEPRITDYLKEY